MNDKREPPRFTHRKKVADAIQLAEGLDDNELIAWAKSRNVPAEAHVRLVRRLRVEGRQRASDALAKIVYDRAVKLVEYKYRHCPDAVCQKIVENAVTEFVKSLVQIDGVDYWEISFFDILMKKAWNEFSKYKRSNEIPNVPGADPSDKSQQRYFSEVSGDGIDWDQDGSDYAYISSCDQQDELRALEDTAIYKAIAAKLLTDEELEFLLLRLQYPVPVKSTKEEVTLDLVRITGHSRTKIFELWNSIVSKLNPTKEKVAIYD